LIKKTLYEIKQVINRAVMCQGILKISGDGSIHERVLGSLENA
jgi:hypothetical protein